jgi:NDP-sugar pyrophosphorylase family protein
MARYVNLIPMAGAGQRFIDAGYLVPKPLIEVDGLPMIVRAARSLPKCDLWVFVCRAEHIAEAHIDRTLKQLFSPCRIITVNHLTEGQACTCLLARRELRPDDVLTIGACDNAMTWDRAHYDHQFTQSNLDFLVWTFRHNPAVLQDPRMYGWVKTGPDATVTGVSVKEPISDCPMDDHAVIGAFTFHRADLFLAACDDMIKANARIKNEFYIDNAINFALSRGARGLAFEVGNYVCWGTPRDLDTYNYWLGVFLAKTTTIK